MKEFITATIADVENALNLLKTAALADSTVEGLAGKKLAAAIELIVPKDGITKDLNQAYTNAEKKWAVNYANDLDNCTKANKLVKIKQYVFTADAYNRLSNAEASKAKVVRWLADKFPVPTEAVADEEKEAA